MDLMGPLSSAIRRRVEDAMGWASGVSLVGEANEHCRVLSDALTDLLDYAVRSGDVMTNTLKEPAVAAALERANNQKAEPHLGGRTARQSEIDAEVLADALNRLASENERLEGELSNFKAKGESMFKCSICGGSDQCDCGSCARCSVPHDGRVYELISRAEKAERELESAKQDQVEMMHQRDEALIRWHAHQKNVPCSGCDGGHDTYWGTVVKSHQWKAWVESSPEFDVHECQACGHISQAHFQAFLQFVLRPSEQERDGLAAVVAFLEGEYLEGRGVPAIRGWGDCMEHLLRKAHAALREGLPQNKETK